MASESIPPAFDAGIEINPKRILVRGDDSVYVSMQDLDVQRRTVSSYARREFKGSGSRFSNGDTLLARITPCLENGKTAYVDFLENGEVAHGSTEFIVLSGKMDTSDSLFVYYLARSPEFRSFAIARMEGSSGRQRVPATTLKRFSYGLPLIPDQRAIAHILGSLDDKIELNRQLNGTLEKMAQSIFKSWFIDFDPVRAKAEGRDPGLPKDIADIFPDSFEDSEIGEIPKGWEVGDLQDLLVLQRGFDLPKKKRLSGEYPLVASSGQDGYHNEYKVNGPGVTTGRSGKLGIVTFVHSNFWPLNTTLWIKTYKQSNPYHAYFLLRTLKLETYNAGSAVPTLNRNHIHNLRLPVPSDNVLNCFALHSQGLFYAINQNIEQVNHLSLIRDTLLPKLISGELRIPDVEKFLEDIE